VYIGKIYTRKIKVNPILTNNTLSPELVKRERVCINNTDFTTIILKCGLLLNKYISITRETYYLIKYAGNGTIKQPFQLDSHIITVTRDNGQIRKPNL
jgi:hypothetical protein